tara:strand:+ start:920 stop:1267 length:348 start_codon:yes stop_codon:yes gene_type:complete
LTESSENNAEKLMGVLINKMEIMDSNLNIIKAENDALRKLINNPQALLRKMGLVSVSTPLTNDLQVDPFRGDMDFSNEIMKSNQQNITSISNEELHEMSWEDIHDMANDARGVAQ